MKSRTIIEQEVDPMLVNINHEKFVTLRRTNSDKKNTLFAFFQRQWTHHHQGWYTMPKTIKHSRWGSSLKITTARRKTWSDTTILIWGGRPTPRHFKNDATSPSCFPSLASYKRYWVRACNISIQHKLKNKIQMIPEWIHLPTWTSRPGDFKHNVLPPKLPPRGGHENINSEIDIFSKYTVAYPVSHPQHSTQPKLR